MSFDIPLTAGRLIAARLQSLLDAAVAGQVEVFGAHNGTLLLTMMATALASSPQVVCVKSVNGFTALGVAMT